jgi:iron complex transport system ATP-binding protein
MKSDKPTQLLYATSLTFSYTDLPVLREVSVSLAAGEIVALLGPNGSGKSTLIRCLLGQLHAQGEIQWQGRSIAARSRRDLARLAAYLPQAPTFDEAHTVADMLRLGRAPYWGSFGLESTRDLQVIEQVAEQLSLTGLMPRRLDELSGGQRQRVFLGRCLVQEPRAMLLDEPSTFLDLRHQVEMCQLLRRLALEQNIGVLLASHDLNLAASFADRLVLLDQGRIAASGNASEVLDPELLQRVYGVKMETISVAGRRGPAVLPQV